MDRFTLKLKGLWLMLLLSLFGMVVLACQGTDPPSPTSSPVPTATAIPQATAMPTAIPTHTPVPSPTAMPTPEPAQLAVAEPTLVPSLLNMPAPMLDGIEGWINSPPLTFEELLGKVVLVDFWTYTCVNCIRTFPYLREWHRKYADSGLVVLGIHAPEFEFEKINANVRMAALEHDLAYPIVQDNEYVTWKAFDTQAWPTKFLVDAEGIVRYVHRGEGAYDETEQVIRDLLEQSGANLSGISAETQPPPEVSPNAFTTSVDTSLTREIYGGFVRNILAGGAYIINPEYYQEINQDAIYEDVGRRRNHFIFLEGVWHNGPESLIHARETEIYEDYIGLEFWANSVNAVLGAAGETPYRVRLQIDGQPVPQEDAGADVIYDENGDSFIEVDEPRMYRLIESDEFDGRELLLSSKSSSFSLYTFTFGAYTEGP